MVAGESRSGLWGADGLGCWFFDVGVAFAVCSISGVQGGLRWGFDLLVMERCEVIDGQGTGDQRPYVSASGEWLRSTA